ncbi:hypothetical protein ACLBX9_07685 [Methylobacterium sp. A49B]|uniref:Uncharacterized protein n=1 Tax=Methylobacterium mesophilicum SR1.6/6 TaxID=908290 RepID=A0A6B9FHD8_9HYPH|nr:hypothetical protein [Methylobacterium mesophilicum]QGY02073.1 hypothetical protein MMSR116_09420 [Methylobacterium mesophilicum SR1.6/6]
MLKKTTRAALCLATLWAVTPALAAPNGMPQGKRDRMSMKDTRHAIAMQRKENREANRNVDSLIKNRR